MNKYMKNSEKIAKDINLMTELFLQFKCRGYTTCAECNLKKALGFCPTYKVEDQIRKFLNSEVNE